MIQLLAHLWGDYIIQSHWMAANKTKISWICGLHAVTYGLPFLFLTLSWKALLMIVITHFFIDRFRLASWIPRFWNNKYEGDPYPDGTPAYISFWVIILIDNTLHMTINYFALKTL